MKAVEARRLDHGATVTWVVAERHAKVLARSAGGGGSYGVGLQLRTSITTIRIVPQRGRHQAG